VGTDQAPSPTRSPTLEDLKRVGAALNAAHAKYLVIGGFAVNFTASRARPKTSTC